jgi:hypothetical protein
VAAVLAGTIGRLGLAWPEVTADKKQAIDEARRKLMAE